MIKTALWCAFTFLVVGGIVQFIIDLCPQWPKPPPPEPPDEKYFE